ncbi:uncharacterized protein FOMMEDRAFT_165625 [Fomitiporia mediterranea MF3/22]|uniref:uncharacterized protein n=1 Tax=Fomitiporia mediterranea (strain MF3/22) TaxID=694068 RepID=UPI00044096D8|nr:uncharacterized protein FOMMEDRAFT_165625 [Fomitiporia mediterranea MF3/22]EJD06979.1 hypothetical protein FOMMEDRAFT_165625 [Fomitiporia mediterranea MF3/22]
MEYQSLSHALNPLPPASRPTYSQPVQLQPSVEHAATHDPPPDASAHREEEEEEEEEVEGTVSAPTGPEKHSPGNQAQAASVSPRRKPGRPKGSKNKKPRFDVTAGSTQKQQFSSTPVYAYPQQSQAQQQPQPPPQQQAPVPQPSAVPAQQQSTSQSASSYPAPDPNNQALYDFQWRVLSLCSEFYNAADELIRNAPQHILHQCFSLPGNQVDPITLLHEARKACDQLMANPAAVVLKVPPQPATVQYASPAPPAKSASPPAGQVITNPGSFVMSLSGSPSQNTQQGTTYSPAATFTQTQPRYPTTPYYAYSTQPSSGSHPYMAQQQVMKPVNLSTPSAAGNQGAWSDEETEKLKQLAEESKTTGTGTENGEIDWDWVCNNWGAGRTRHQILIKATNLNLKESSSRATKRRRDPDPSHGTIDGPSNVNHSPSMNGHANSSVSNTSAQAVLNAVAAAASAGASPVSIERPASTSTSVSPVTVHPQQQPPPPPPAPPGGGNLMHWPIQHVATNAPSPVLSSGSLGSRSVYYNRDRNGSKA